MNYYRHYVGDYLRDTSRLSMLEHGAYSLMLNYYYAEEQPLPLDRNELYTMLRAMTPADRKAVDKVLGLYFESKPDGYHQKRADEEIEVSHIARANGKKGGRPVTRSGTGPKTEPETGNGTGGDTYNITGDGTEGPTGQGGGSGHPPTTNLQPPTPNPQPPPSQPPGEQPAVAEHRGNSTPTATGSVAPAQKRAARPAKDAEAKTTATWTSYSLAYGARYGVDPTPNARVRSQLSAFIDRVGKDDAPEIAAFYVRHNKAFYVQRQHPVGLLLADAEGLRTQWLNGRTVTETEARQVDRKQNNLSIAERLIAKERAKHGE